MTDQAKININDRARFKLSEYGTDLVTKHSIQLRQDKVDPEYFSCPLWELMQQFGPHIAMGLPTPFEYNSLEIHPT